MAEKVGDAFVQLDVRGLPQYDSRMNAAQARLSGLGRLAIRVGATIGAVLGGRAIVRGLAQFTKEAADATETVNKFDQVFSGVAGTANTVAESFARDFGLAGVSARKLLADTGDILVGFGFAEDKALDLTRQINELAVDLASFTNIEGGAARASQALTKLVIGETEQAKALGIVVRQNSDEFKGLVKQLRSGGRNTLLQAKAMAALRIAFSQTQKAQGDYQRTANSFANRLKFLGERFKDLRIAVGQAFIQFIGGSKAVNNVIGRVDRLRKRLAEMAKAGFFANFAERIRAGMAGVVQLGRMIGPVLAAIAADMGRVVAAVAPIIRTVAEEVLRLVSLIAPAVKVVTGQIVRLIQTLAPALETLAKFVVPVVGLIVLGKGLIAVITGISVAIKAVGAAAAITQATLIPLFVAALPLILATALAVSAIGIALAVAAGEGDTFGKRLDSGVEKLLKQLGLFVELADEIPNAFRKAGDAADEATKPKKIDTAITTEIKAKTPQFVGIAEAIKRVQESVGKKDKETRLLKESQKQNGFLKNIEQNGKEVADAVKKWSPFAITP
jgi:hypothetical protein